MANVYANRWQNLGPIGEGGQAHVYRVKDLTGEVEKVCALKRIRNQERLERFRDEIEAVMRLQHDHIVQFVDYSLEVDKPYLVTEYCEGGNLEDANPKFWQASPVKALELFQDICNAVRFAHAHDVIHRDLKPRNIYLKSPNGPVVVGDFGICYLADQGRRITLTEEAVGSRYYMAPELADGRVQNNDNRCDTYSLGKVLYWLISGDIFDREKHRDAKYDLRERYDMPGRTWKYIYMEHVNRLLDHMIKENPNDRFHLDSIGGLIRETIHLLKGEFTPIAPDMLHQQPCRYCGIGVYKIVATNPTDAGNIGFQPRGSSDPRVLICDECGHVEMFRVDKAKQKQWWGSTD
jgi:serine/threonine protein kinase